MKIKHEPSSFRDPAGFLFRYQQVLYRQINKVAKDNFDQFISSGLYQKLVKKNLLIPHQEVALDKAQSKEAYKIIKPKTIPFISYPYEWSFSQLKDAALLTLQIQKIAFEHGLSLRDASAYNIQFIGSRPIFIDSLSFEKYQEGSPWIAYRQFCQHFLAPLALSALTDLRLNQLSRLFIDGLPLDLASRLLPKKTWFNFSLLIHLHLHARSQTRFADNRLRLKDKKINLSSFSYRAFLDNLQSAVHSLKLKNVKTEWADYYQFTNYDQTAFESKKKIVKQYIAKIKPKTVWDFGANTGEFSLLAAQAGAYTIAWDIDPLSVEKNYLRERKSLSQKILPLIVDLTNPSPDLGWHLRERSSLLRRGPVDMVLALALIHHLAITNNTPLSSIASFLADCASSAIIEFVPKDDSQVQKLLKNREDIFSSYTQAEFEKKISQYFSIVNKTPVINSKRTIYLVVKK